MGPDTPIGHIGPVNPIGWSVPGAPTAPTCPNGHVGPAVGPTMRGGPPVLVLAGRFDPIDQAAFSVAMLNGAELNVAIFRVGAEVWAGVLTVVTTGRAVPEAGIGPIGSSGGGSEEEVGT